MPAPVSREPASLVLTGAEKQHAAGWGAHRWRMTGVRLSPGARPPPKETALDALTGTGAKSCHSMAQPQQGSRGTLPVRTGLSPRLPAPRSSLAPVTSTRFQQQEEMSDQQPAGVAHLLQAQLPLPGRV